MRVHLVSYEGINDWILGKFARRLHRELLALGIDATVGQAARPDADINHHIVYFDYEARGSTLETVMITHINDERELGKVRKQLVDLDVDMGICMSFEAVHRLAHFGIPRHKLCFVSPAHDDAIRPRPTVVGITTRLYPGGCKREALLEELVDFIDPGDFRFVIMGTRWESVIERIRAKGFDVEYVDRFDEAQYRQLMPTFDYYLYLGLDEGSMGFLDALAAGVPTIVTPQGFHLDIPGGITHPVVTIDDLRRVFASIADAKRARVTSVASWTWASHAKRHVAIWDYLRRRTMGRSIPPELVSELESLALVQAVEAHGI